MSQHGRPRTHAASDMEKAIIVARNQRQDAPLSPAARQRLVERAQKGERVWPALVDGKWMIFDYTRDGDHMTPLDQYVREVMGL